MLWFGPAFCKSLGLEPDPEMAKCLLLLLLVVLSSLLGLPQALECFQCNRVNASGVCETGGNTCQTQGSQQCFLRRIYENGTLSYGHQGCSQLCIPMKLFNPSVIVEYKCCHDSPLCNKF
ncbi:secreted seminal-vesicle Ly-6 protein 1-like [Bos indicus x Bos taurus]|uniref:secreted seminal-vesicle Ly-6 protein 1-like n=1 Tax=Bos indicus x Bos taurus TaxID=30522 RepID=UPI000F7D58CF|nr:secreted seminal-vesicle Ly-6 protein 1-like [Bos indicus x Bos taurus]